MIMLKCNKHRDVNETGTFETKTETETKIFETGLGLETGLETTMIVKLLRDTHWLFIKAENLKLSIPVTSLHQC